MKNNYRNQLTVTLKDEEYYLFKDKVARENKSVSKVLRRLVYDFIGKKPPELPIFADATAKKPKKNTII